MIWRQQAENLANWAKKGSLIGLTGRIQTRNYENQQGQRVYVTEVVADSFQMLESKGGSKQNSDSLMGTAPDFARDPGSITEISDDDMPF